MITGGRRLLETSRITNLVSLHPCSSHSLFDYLENTEMQAEQALRLLVNYDAHAALLRRLLLKAAAIMPEQAVGYVIENVRNEYGNGDWQKSHGLQVRDLIETLERKYSLFDLSVSVDSIESGVRLYMKEVVRYYSPTADSPKQLYKPAIVAGAITATEVMALKEFESMHEAFARFNLADHIWFDHVLVESEHKEEALALAEYFLDRSADAVEYGLVGVLDLNIHLYDGLYAACRSEGEKFVEQSR